MNTQLVSQLTWLGLEAGDLILVHSSFKSLGVDDPEVIIGALLDVIGRTGTLLMPALSFRQEPPDVHDTDATPSCVGFLTEYFRTRAGTLRSLHPTHSVCAAGGRAEDMVAEHWRDDTPCGRYSPFNRLIELKGKILMIGCGLRPNTTMHAIEEYVGPPYLYGPPREYTITDECGVTFQQTYRTHGFTSSGYRQRYDRVEGLLSASEHRTGLVGTAACHLIDAAALHRVALHRIQDDPYYFVERITTEQ